MLVSEILTKDEKVELLFKPDFFATFLPTVFVGLFILIANAMLFFNSSGSPLMFKFFLLILALSIIGYILSVTGLYLKYIYTFYLVTNKRLIYQTGVVSKEQRDCRLERVQDISVDVSFLDRILNVGNIGFSTAGGPGIELVFMTVKNPLEVKRLINEIIDKDVSSTSKGV